MRALRSFVVTVVAFVVLAAPAVVPAHGRVALVVGDSTYAHIARLPDADNDAADMSAALRRLGFEVTTERAADRAELTEALRAFTRRSVGPTSRSSSTRATASRWTASTIWCRWTRGSSGTSTSGTRR